MLPVYIVTRSVDITKTDVYALSSHDDMDHAIRSQRIAPRILDIPGPVLVGFLLEAVDEPQSEGCACSPFLLSYPFLLFETLWSGISWDLSWSSH